MPTSTTRAPALSKSAFRSRNCATCSRQNGQPKCRRNTNTKFPRAQNSLSRLKVPSDILTLASIVRILQFDAMNKAILAAFLL
jgi:hypothetical protein